jgi:hypothetical protein
VKELELQRLLEDNYLWWTCNGTEEEIVHLRAYFKVTPGLSRTMNQEGLLSGCMCSYQYSNQRQSNIYQISYSCAIWFENRVSVKIPRTMATWGLQFANYAVKNNSILSTIVAMFLIIIKKVTDGGTAYFRKSRHSDALPGSFQHKSFPQWLLPPHLVPTHFISAFIFSFGFYSDILQFIKGC